MSMETIDCKGGKSLKYNNFSKWSKGKRSRWPWSICL